MRRETTRFWCLGRASALGLMLAASSCGDAEKPRASGPAQNEVLEAADVDFTIDQLRTYCKACHAVGSLRFIRSDDNQEVWDHLFANRSPNSGKIWAEAIIETLSWPSDQAPPFDQPMDPERGKDWMPKGARRLDLASARHDGTPVRRLIIEALKDHGGE